MQAGPKQQPSLKEINKIMNFVATKIEFNQALLSEIDVQCDEETAEKFLNALQPYLNSDPYHETIEMEIHNSQASNYIFLHAMKYCYLKGEFLEEENQKGLRCARRIFIGAIKAIHKESTKSEYNNLGNTVIEPYLQPMQEAFATFMCTLKANGYFLELQSIHLLMQIAKKISSISTEKIKKKKLNEQIWQVAHGIYPCFMKALRLEGHIIPNDIYPQSVARRLEGMFMMGIVYAILKAPYLEKDHTEYPALSEDDEIKFKTEYELAQKDELLEKLGGLILQDKKGDSLQELVSDFLCSKQEPHQRHLLLCSKTPQQATKVFLSDGKTQGQGPVLIISLEEARKKKTVCN